MIEDVVGTVGKIFAFRPHGPLFDPGSAEIVGKIFAFRPHGPLFLSICWKLTCERLRWINVSLGRVEDCYPLLTYDQR